MNEPLGFEPVTFYDAPGVILNNMLEGRMTPRLLRDAVFDPQALSPIERQDLSSLVGDGEQGGIARALVGVATNPFVWLYLLTGPVGAKAIGQGASIFQLSKTFAPQLKRAAPFWSILDTFLEESRGGAAGEAVMHVTGLLRSVKEEAGAIIAPAEKRLAAKLSEVSGLKITSLDPDDAVYRPGSPESNFVRHYMRAADADAHELIDGRVRNPERVVQELDILPYVRDREGKIIRTLEPEDPALVGDHEARRLMVDRVGKELVKEREKGIRDAWFGTNGEMAKMEMRGRYTTVEEAIEAEGWFIDDFREIKRVEVPSDPTIFTENMGDVLDLAGEAHWDWVRAKKVMHQKLYVQALGNERVWDQSGKLVFDDSKVANLIAAFQKYEDGLDQPASGLMGLEALIAATSPETVREIGRRVYHSMREPGRFDEMVGQVKKLLDPGKSWDDVYWRSRNFYESQPVTIAGKKVRPMGATTADGAAARRMTPWAKAHVDGDAGESRVAGLTPKELEVHIDDLEAEMPYLNGEGHRMARVLRAKAQRAYGDNGQLRMGLRLNYGESSRRAHNQLSTLWALDLTPMPEKVLKADRDTLGNVAPELKESSYITGRGFEQYRRDVDLTALSADAKRGVTYRMIVNRAVQGELSPARRATLAKNATTTALGMAGPEYLAVYNTQVRAKELASWFANSFAGKAIAKTGKWGSDFITDLKAFGDFGLDRGPAGLSKGLASWLYVTHLGANVSSVVLNLTQPLLLAATIAKPGEVIEAYTNAFKQMASYAKWRSGIGQVFLNDAQKLEGIRRAFPLAAHREGDSIRNLIGVGPDFHDLIEHGLGRQRGWAAKGSELLMKGFEKSEWFNRIVVGEMLRSVHMKRLGKLGDTFADDVERLMYQTQFAAHEMNTPRLFRSGPLANPLARMFMTFPLRSFTNVVRVFPTLGGETNYWKGFFNTAGRGMATSALIYEVGKGLMGVDLSRGLFLGASTDLLGGERILQDGNDWVPVPPVVDIPLDALRATASGDMQLMGDTLARLVPGGVALARALSIAPEAPRGAFGLPGSLQKTYVGWNMPLADGSVPVFSGSGNLVGYESPSALILKGLGADLGAGREQGAVDGYLVRQREEIVQQRHELMRAIASGEMGRAQQLQGAFQERYGFPLTVTQDQVRNYLRNQTVGRSERILNRTDASARAMLGAMADPSGKRSGVRGGLTQEGATVSGRDPYRERGVDPRQIEEIQRRIQAVGGAATQDTSSFSPFGGFGGR